MTRDRTSGRVGAEHDHDETPITWDEIDADAEARPIFIIRRQGRGSEVGQSESLERFDPRDH